MSLASKASRVLTNKYFLYFIVFLSVTNILGYLVTNKLNAVIFFGLVSLLTYQFSKNMAVVLLVGLITTSLIMSNRIMREGLENASESDKMEKLGDISPEMKQAAETLDKTDSVEQTKAKLEENKVNANKASIEEPVTTTDINNPDLNKGSGEAEPEGAGQKLSNNKKVNLGGKTNGPRIDYSATMEEAYNNLDKILGSDGVSKLTQDTQKLMAQQQKLFDTMQNMTPMLQNAKEMLSGFDMKSLGNLANLAQSIPGVQK
jgi:uncharacterized membrane protein YciS (DUF1049 family)